MTSLDSVTVFRFVLSAPCYVTSKILGRHAHSFVRLFLPVYLSWLGLKECFVLCWYNLSFRQQVISRPTSEDEYLWPSIVANIRKMKNKDIICIVLFLQNEIIRESKHMDGYRQQMLSLSFIIILHWHFSTETFI